MITMKCLFVTSVRQKIISESPAAIELRMASQNTGWAL